MGDREEWASDGGSEPDPVADARPFPFADPLPVGSLEAPAADIVGALAPQLTPARRRRIARTVHYRSGNVALVLEHIHDEGNIAAVMRSAEAFGFGRLHLVPAPAGSLAPTGRDGGGRAPSRVTQGADKWLEVHVWPDIGRCLTALRAEGYAVWATALGRGRFELAGAARRAGVPLPRVALVLGGERNGVSTSALAHADINVQLPMRGLAQSFNVSVAAALAMQELSRHSPARYDRAQRRMLTAAYYTRSVPGAESILRQRTQSSR